MSQENVEAIARLYDEFLAKPERLASPEMLAFFDPLSRSTRASRSSGPRALPGLRGPRPCGARVFAVFREGHLRPRTSRGRRATSRGDGPFPADGKESGVRVSETVPPYWTIEPDGSCALTVYLDPAEPSKPLGCRSSRCRRRTSRSLAGGCGSSSPTGRRQAGRPPSLTSGGTRRSNTSKTQMAGRWGLPGAEAIQAPLRGVPRSARQHRDARRGALGRRRRSHLDISDGRKECPDRSPLRA